jgi:hypothetical protein
MTKEESAVLLGLNTTEESDTEMPPPPPTKRSVLASKNNKKKFETTVNHPKRTVSFSDLLVVITIIITLNSKH